jgi:hypothetical protein
MSKLLPEKVSIMDQDHCGASYAGVSLIGIPQHTNSIRVSKDKPHSPLAIGELASGEGAGKPESEYWAS